MDWASYLDVSQSTWESLRTPERLKRIWEDNSDAFGKRFDSWPPTDAVGNEMPLQWVPVDDLYVHDGRVKLDDEEGRGYKPLAGNVQPVDGRCNARLQNWADRYDDARFCTAWPTSDSNYCHTHQNHRESIMVTAKEAMQTGASSKTRDHLFNKLSADKELIAHGTHEDLLGDSRFEFAPEYTTKELDFSDLEWDLDDVLDQEGPVYEIEVVHATEYIDRSLHLLAAAIDTVKQMNIQPMLAEADMRSKTTSHAQLTSPESGEQFRTLEEWNEHYLNLAYDRVIRGRQELLKYGGVAVDGETDNGAGDAADFIERIQNLQDDDGFVTADAEIVQEGSEMNRQVEAAGGELETTDPPDESEDDEEEQSPAPEVVFEDVDE